MEIPVVALHYCPTPLYLYMMQLMSRLAEWGKISRFGLQQTASIDRRSHSCIDPLPLTQCILIDRQYSQNSHDVQYYSSSSS